MDSTNKVLAQFASDTMH